MREDVLVRLKGVQSFRDAGRAGEEPEAAPEQKDIDKAVRCYRRGAAHGDRFSQERLKALGRQ